MRKYWKSLSSKERGCVWAFIASTVVLIATVAVHDIVAFGNGDIEWSKRGSILVRQYYDDGRPDFFDPPTVWTFEAYNAIWLYLHPERDH